MDRRNFLKTMGAGAVSMAIFCEYACSGGRQQQQLHQLPSIGLITGSNGAWHSDGPKEGLKQIAQWGYTDLEGGSIRGMENEEYLLLVKSLGLRPLIGSAGMEVLIDEERLKPTIDGYLAQGREYLTCYWPWLSGGLGDKIDHWKEVADNLNKGVAVCKREGIKLIYHNHDMEFYRVEEQMPFDVMMSHLDPAVDIQLDLYWITRSGQSAEEYINKYPGRYPVLHVKDMPANIKPGTGLTDFGALTVNDFAAIGSGTVDFPNIFKLNDIAGAKHFIVESDHPGDVPTFLETSAKYLLALKF